MSKDKESLSLDVKEGIAEVVSDYELPVHKMGDHCATFMATELAGIEAQTHAYVKGRHPKSRFRAVDTGMTVYRETSRAAVMFAKRWVTDECLAWENKVKRQIRRLKLILIGTGIGLVHVAYMVIS